MDMIVIVFIVGISMAAGWALRWVYEVTPDRSPQSDPVAASVLDELAPSPEQAAEEAARAARPSLVRFGPARTDVYRAADYDIAPRCVRDHELTEGQPFFRIELPSEAEGAELAVCRDHASRQQMMTTEGIRRDALDD